LTDDTKEQHSPERTKAEAQFKQATEGGRAKADYVAAGHSERAKTERLRALRLAKEAAEKKKP
jgi:hypothetical protein